MLAHVLILLQVQTGPEPPRDVVARATRAIEQDSVSTVSRSWSARRSRDSTDWAARLGIAVLARLSYDYQSSDSGFATLIRSAPSSAGRYVAAAHLERGRGLQTRGSSAAADTAYFLAAAEARRAGDRSLEGAALIALAAVRLRTLGPRAADSLLTGAYRVIPADDHATRAEYECGRAAMLQLTGRAGVDSAARRGLELAQRAASRRQAAYCQRILAAWLLNSGTRPGLALFQEVVDELSAVRDRAALASALQWRGFLRFTYFDFGPARSDLLRAVSEGLAAQAGSPVAWALVNLVQISVLAGDLAAARAYADSADALFQRQNDRFGLGVVRAFRGEVAYAAGDLATARALMEQGLASAEATGFARSIVAGQISLATIAMDEGKVDEAAARLARARRAASRGGLVAEDSGLRYPLARLATMRGDFRGAERELRHIVEAGLDRVQPGAAYKYRVRLADIMIRQGRAADAQQELHRAYNTFDVARAGLTDRELRSRVLQSLRDVNDPHLGIPNVLAGLVAAGRTEAAFELAERRKAQTLLQRLVLREAMGAPRAESASTPGGERDVGSALTPANVLAGIPDDSTAVLEYATGGGAPSTLFLLTRSGISALRLAPLDSIAGDIRRFMALIESGEDAKELGHALATALLDEAASRLAATVTRLVIVPDAGLQRLAFDALILPDGRRLGERFAVSISPSASVAVRLWRVKSSAEPVRLLAMGDPRFPNEVEPGTEATVYREAFAANGGLPRLVASAREARAVARYAANADVRLREDASEAWLKRTDLRGFRVLHFATHALVDEHAPTRTALALAPDGSEDGFLTPSDFGGLELDADLVVLSACRTAVGVFVHGEGVEGLTAPLLESGARSVVASLWRVSDRSSADFIVSFYRELAGGATTGDALAAAKRGAIARGESPAVWAAFTLVGNPSIRIPLRSPPSTPWTWIVVAAGGLAIAYGLMMVRRRRSERI